MVSKLFLDFCQKSFGIGQEDSGLSDIRCHLKVPANKTVEAFCLSNFALRQTYMNDFNLRQTLTSIFSNWCKFLLLFTQFQDIFSLESGVIYCWGANTHGQCGVPGPRIACNDSDENVKMFTEPKRVKLPTTNIKRIHCGWSSVVVLTGNSALKLRSNLMQHVYWSYA